MTELAVPVLTGGVVLPLVAAIAASRVRQDSRARTITIVAIAASLLASAEALREVTNAGGAALPERWTLPFLGANWQWFGVDGLSAVLMVLFPALALFSVIAAPRRDADRRFLVSTLTVLSATLAVYCSQNLLVFFLGWTGSLLPFLIRGGHDHWFAVSRFTMIGSAAALGIAIAIIAITGTQAGLADPLSMVDLSHSAGNVWVFAALVVGAVLRSGIFPAHRGVAASLGGGSLLLSTLLMNSHQGLFLMARLAVPVFQSVTAEVLPWLCGVALLTCLYMAVLGLAERKPEALLASVFVSQSAGLFAGLVTATPEGVTGALLQWIVLAVCSTVLVIVYRCLQTRTSGHPGGDGFLGLAARAPRFAAFFAVSGLALAGMPGTLGFSGEDLLMHGALSAHPWMGAALPIAIALNAYHVFRLFARLFLGKQHPSLSSVRDALPRERWVLAACIVPLIWLGLVPGHAVHLRAPAARAVLGSAPAAASHVR